MLDVLLSQFFYNNSIKSIFDTYEVAVYDGSKLIGLSYFDFGQKSVASLLSVYDVTDEYKKYSLGVYTMLLEVVYAQEQDKTYYYPGYVLDKPSEICVGGDELIPVNDLAWILVLFH